MTCPTCHGTGNGEFIRRIEYVGGNWAEVYRVCETCDGLGEVEDDDGT